MRINHYMIGKITYSFRSNMLDKKIDEQDNLTQILEKS